MKTLTFGPVPGSGWAERVPLDGDPDPLCIDLRNLNNVDPLLMLRLAALLDRYQESAVELRVEPPRSPSIRRKLMMMQVDCDSQLLRLSETPQLPGDRSLLPVVRFSKPQDVDSLAERLQAMLTKHFKAATRPLAQTLFVALSELCDNAVTHGENPLGAFAAASGDPSGRCLLAVGDLGVGIPTHIRRTLPDVGDDGSAIGQAMLPGTSGAGLERGVGYSGLFVAIERSKAPTARLRVWSAAGRMTATYRHGRMIHKAGRLFPRHTDGTWVSLELLAP